MAFSSLYLLILNLSILKRERWVWRRPWAFQIVWLELSKLDDGPFTLAMEASFWRWPLSLPMWATCCLSLIRSIDPAMLPAIIHTWKPFHWWQIRSFWASFSLCHHDLCRPGYRFSMNCANHSRINNINLLSNFNTQTNSHSIKQNFNINYYKLDHT